MDRQTIYAGQIPLDTDQLKQSQNTLVGLAKLSAAVLGKTTIVNEFVCSPTTPASLGVIVTAGEIYQLENLEASVWGSLGADSHSILKQGVLLDPVSLGITPPTTNGYSQVFLVEVQYADLDAGSLVLPYFNAGAPLLPFSGPGNAGSAQNTVRKGVVAVQIKAGAAAPTGSQQAPTPDAGWTGIYTVTVANGAMTITSGNIALVIGSPFIPTTLPLVPLGVQSGKWVYAIDTGTANAIVATAFTPAITALVPGMTVRIKKVAHPNTGACTLDIGTGANTIVLADGSTPAAGNLPSNGIFEYVWTGSNWQTLNFLGSGSGSGTGTTTVQSIPYAVDSGAANAVVAAFNPAITTLAAGLIVLVKIAASNTGDTQIIVNGLPAVHIVHRDVSALVTGDLIPGDVVTLIFDGTFFQLIGRSISPQFFIWGSGGSFTWTCPAGVYWIKLKVTGAGGGAGSTPISEALCAGCGGGGGVAEGYYPVTPGSSYNLVVGFGGPGQTSTSGGNGQAGGTSTFSTFASATGGGGGLGQGSGTLRGGLSGNGSGGNLTNYGLGDGSTGSQLFSGNTNLIAPGCGGGPGGQAGAGSGNFGFPGRGPGGGGGGTSNCEVGSTGGNGAVGEIRIDFIIS